MIIAIFKIQAVHLCRLRSPGQDPGNILFKRFISYKSLNIP